VSSLQSFREGKLKLRDWMKSYRGVQETGIFAMDDPLPAWWTGVRNVRNLWKRRRGEDRSQKTEVRSQKSEVRSQKSEVRSQRSLSVDWFS